MNWGSETEQFYQTEHVVNTTAYNEVIILTHQCQHASHKALFLAH